MSIPNNNTLNVILASTLLDRECDTHYPASPLNTCSWSTGSESLDDTLPTSLWQSNRVIGYASETKPGGGATGAASLPIQIVARHILDGRMNGNVGTEVNSRPARSSTVFIISSPSQASTTIRSVHARLGTELARSATEFDTNTTRSHNSDSDDATKASTATAAAAAEATELLSTIQILPYLDLPGLLSCLSETARALPDTQPCILLVQSLPLTIETTRRQGPIQTTALTSRVMSSLRSLAASNSSCLILLELSAEWTTPTTVSNTTPRETNITRSTREKTEGKAIRLETAFSPTLGSRNMLCLNARAGDRVADAEMREVFQACDRVVAVHDCDGRTGGRERVVEVVKSDEEELLGVWGVWRYK